MIKRAIPKKTSEPPDDAAAILSMVWKSAGYVIETFYPVLLSNGRWPGFC